MTALPAISILLPFYNARATLEAALLSIKDQSFDDYEVLAVDDGSTDGSDEIVRDVAANDRRIKLLQPRRLGLVGALNRGLAEARAPLIARMDADDLMRPERLEAQYGYLRENPEIGLVGCRVHLFPEALIQAGFREYIRWQNDCLTPEDLREEIYVESPIAHPSMVFRRAIVTDLGGYRDGLFPEDYELLLRLNAAGVRLGKVDRTLLDWRESGERLTRTDGRYARESFDRLRADYLARDRRLHLGRPLAFWGAGRKTRRRSGLLLERGHRPAAWIDIDPRKIGNRVAGARVVPPEWLDRSERPFVLSYVTNHGARGIIAAQLEALGYRRGEDYLMVG